MFNQTPSLSTRELILEFLSQKATCCDDLSAALHLTKPDIQYHLNALLTKGIITEKQLEFAESSRGRPKKYYTVVAANSKGLSEDLHQVFLFLLQSHQSDNKSLLQQISWSLFGETHETNNYLVAIQRLIKIFNDHHFQPRWEIRSNGIMILLSSCPFRPLIENTDFFCKLDELTIEQNTGLTVTETSCQRLNSQPYCKFILTQR